MASSTGSGDGYVDCEIHPEDYPSITFSDRVVSDDYLPGLRTVEPAKDDWQRRYETACVTIRELRAICKEAREAAWRANQMLQEVRNIVLDDRPRP